MLGRGPPGLSRERIRTRPPAPSYPADPFGTCGKRIADGAEAAVGQPKQKAKRSRRVSRGMRHSAAEWARADLNNS